MPVRKVAHHPNQLAGDLPAGILGGEDELGAQPQFEGLEQLDPHVGGQPVVGLEVAALLQFLVQDGKAGLDGRVDPQNACRPRPGRGAGHPVDGQSGGHGMDSPGKVALAQDLFHQGSRLGRHPVLQGAAAVESG